MTDDEIVDAAIAGIREDQVNLGLCIHGKRIDDLDCRDCDTEPDAWAEQDPPIFSEVAQVFVDVAALLAGGLPKQPPPVLLHREDGQDLDSPRCVRGGATGREACCVPGPRPQRGC